jgi:hypothetical protein
MIYKTAITIPIINQSIIWNSSITLINLLEYFNFCSFSVDLQAYSEIFVTEPFLVIRIIDFPSRGDFYFFLNSQIFLQWNHYLIITAFFLVFSRFFGKQ